MRWGLVFVLAFGCSPTTIEGGGDDAGPTDASRRDVNFTDTRPGDVPRPEDAPGFDGGSVLDDGGMAISEGRAEVCGNGVDDDGDERIDDGCECTVGTVRPCWLGPLASQGVGQCSDGQQACEPEGAVANWGFCVDQVLPSVEYLGDGRDNDCDGDVDEAGGLCLSSVNDETGLCNNLRDDDCDGLVDCEDPDCVEDARCEPECQPNETLCYGGYDDDCDGDVDCEDTECAGNLSCGEPPCDNAVYTQRDLGTRRGSSGIEAGDGEPNMPVTCGGSRCISGQVEVRRGDSSQCVPPPPACPEGQYATYKPRGWVCEPPCEVIIQYGYIYGFQRRCAERPDPDCPSGQVQTYREDIEQWRCDPTCDNTLYDRVWLDGQLVCVPC